MMATVRRAGVCHSSMLLVLAVCMAVGMAASGVVARMVPGDSEMHDILRRGREQGLSDGELPQIELISWEPRAFLYRNLLSEEEADYLVALAKPKMQKSRVVDSSTGGSMDSNIRTSEGAWLGRSSDPVVGRVEQRIAAWTHIPASHGEDIHVLHYAEGQKYEPHWDSFFDSLNTQNGGNRYATVLMYLHTTEAGGETTFPQADHFDPAAIDNTDKSECAQNKLSVKPRKGDAILFYDFYINGELDRHSLHGACPVVKGDKWAATKWMRVSPTSPSVAEVEADQRQKRLGTNCGDIDPRCPKWAFEGHCESNPPFMVGYPGKLGRCRASCKACSSVQIPL